MRKFYWSRRKINKVFDTITSVKINRIEWQNTAVRITQQRNNSEKFNSVWKRRSHTFEDERLRRIKGNFRHRDVKKLGSKTPRRTKNPRRQYKKFYRLSQRRKAKIL